MKRRFTSAAKHWRAMLAGVVCAAAASAAPVTLFHVHGLAYSPDGKQILVPAHFGLAIYTQDGWTKAGGPEHDFMGFSATRTAFYSSGHPAADSDLPNPFGLLKSADGGAHWESLGLSGEADFHVMAAGYDNNVVYVFNVAPNSRMMRAGLHYTPDDGKHWYYARREGAPEPVTLAVHPSRPEVVAIGAQNGLYVSTDHGQTFTRRSEDRAVYAVAFDLDGEHLWFAGIDDAPYLMRMAWKSGTAQSLALPFLEQDTAVYISQNPARPREMALATYRRNVYVSTDQGLHWQAIAKDGMAVASP